MKKTLFIIFLLCLTLVAQAKKQTVKPQFSGYLFAYFEGGGDKILQEQLRFAVSEDAKNWYALNGNQDGIVDTQDVLCIYQYIQDGTFPIEGDTEACDVNLDGIVDTQDVLKIYEYIINN